MNAGTLGTAPGKRDEVVAFLTRRNPQLNEAGCLFHEVGAGDGAPDTVFVAEPWTSAQAHRAPLQPGSVRAASAEAMPLLSGQTGGNQFAVAGSPLHG